MANASVANAIELGRSMFGERPDDVIAMVETGSETLAQLADLMRAIRAEAGENPTIQRLAKLGSYVADDVANLLDDQRGSLKDALNRFMEGTAPVEENSATAAVDTDYKDRFYKLNNAMCGSTLDWLQIKAIARLVSEEHEFNQPGFSEEVYGGVIAILNIAARAHDDLTGAVS